MWQILEFWNNLTRNSLCQVFFLVFNLSSDSTNQRSLKQFWDIKWKSVRTGAQWPIYMCKGHSTQGLTLFYLGFSDFFHFLTTRNTWSRILKSKEVTSKSVLAVNLGRPRPWKKKMQFTVYTVTFEELQFAIFTTDFLHFYFVSKQSPADSEKKILTMTNFYFRLK